MEVLEVIKRLLADILDMEVKDILPEAYIVRELGAESIDLLEMAVSLNAAFNIEVNDADIFLLRLRDHVTEAAENKTDVVRYLAERLPFLKRDRIADIVSDLEGGPTLKVKDLVSYVEWRRVNG
ncbi:Phosphopantetheine-binding [uncultured Desulfobacterium sp.]|uniref:Phosphopantetheine-binding n=1 Tax=uncultured Desulfobacterium sp. TaxID=201089 RepID=A0A445MUH8_9BACT|nr:Phosphopantetheine-binding [uncultured Desulfobacterium sp.]